MRAEKTGSKVPLDPKTILRSRHQEKEAELANYEMQRQAAYKRFEDKEKYDAAFKSMAESAEVVREDSARDGFAAEILKLASTLNELGYTEKLSLIQDRFAEMLHVDSTGKSFGYPTSHLADGLLLTYVLLTGLHDTTVDAVHASFGESWFEGSIVTVVEELEFELWHFEQLRDELDSLKPKDVAEVHAEFKKIDNLAESLRSQQDAVVRADVMSLLHLDGKTPGLIVRWHNWVLRRKNNPTLAQNLGTLAGLLGRIARGITREAAAADQLELLKSRIHKEFILEFPEEQADNGLNPKSLANEIVVEDVPSSSGIDEDIEFLDPAGSGLKGNVFRARQVSLDRVVAVKTIKHDFGGDALEHAKKMARIDSHPNVVSVHLVTKVLSPIDEIVCNAMIMEWLEGRKLETVLQGPQLEVGQARRICFGIIGGLRHIHCEGVPHSDLHAGNILILDDFTPKIIDADEELFPSFAKMSSMTIEQALASDLHYCRDNVYRVCSHSKLAWNQVVDAQAEMRRVKDLNELMLALETLFDGQETSSRVEPSEQIVELTRNQTETENASNDGNLDSRKRHAPILVQGHQLEDRANNRSYVVVTVLNVDEDNFPPYSLGLRNVRGVLYQGGFSCEKTGELLPTQKREHKFLLKGNPATDGFLCETEPDGITLVVQLEDSEKVLFESVIMGRSLTEALQILHRDGSIKTKEPVWWRMNSASENLQA